MAVRSKWGAYLYLPEKTLDNCLDMFSQILSSYDSNSEMSYEERSCIKEVVKSLPDEINNQIQIIRLERKLGARYFKKKLFDKSVNKFVTVESICYKEEDDIKEFDDFIKFYEYLDGDLEIANLDDFDFKGLDLNNFNIEGAYISTPDYLVCINKEKEKT